MAGGRLSAGGHRALELCWLERECGRDSERKRQECDVSVSNRHSGMFLPQGEAHGGPGSGKRMEKLLLQAQGERDSGLAESGERQEVLELEPGVRRERCVRKAFGEAPGRSRVSKASGTSPGAVKVEEVNKALLGNLTGQPVRDELGQWNQLSRC